MEKKRKSTLVSILYLLILVSLGRCVLDNNSAEAKEPQKIKVIYVYKDETQKENIEAMLKSLHKKCINSEKAILTLTINAQSVLKHMYGAKIPVLDLLKAANKSVPDITPKADYKKVVLKIMRRYR
jgi:hypothetical protein